MEIQKIVVILHCAYDKAHLKTNFNLSLGVQKIKIMDIICRIDDCGGQNRSFVSVVVNGETKHYALGITLGNSAWDKTISLLEKLGVNIETAKYVKDNKRSKWLYAKSGHGTFGACYVFYKFEGKEPTYDEVVKAANKLGDGFGMPESDYIASRDLVNELTK